MPTPLESLRARARYRVPRRPIREIGLFVEHGTRPVSPLVRGPIPGNDKDVLAPEKKPDRKVVERKQAIVEKQKVADEANDDEPNAEAPRVSAEPDRPTREGF